MTSNALFFVLWETLSTGSSLGFKFRTDIDEPSLTASVFVVSEYNFFPKCYTKLSAWRKTL